MGVAQKTQKYIHTPTGIWYSTKEPKIYIGENIVSVMNGAGKTEYPHVKTETRSLPLILYKNKLKVDQRP
jgi:hypothetical protein